MFFSMKTWTFVGVKVLLSTFMRKIVSLTCLAHPLLEVSFPFPCSKRSSKYQLKFHPTYKNLCNLI